MQTGFSRRRSLPYVNLNKLNEGFPAEYLLDERAELQPWVRRTSGPSHFLVAVHVCRVYRNGNTIECVARC